jgi:hypothetical protein
MLGTSRRSFDWETPYVRPSRPQCPELLFSRTWKNRFRSVRPTGIGPYLNSPDNAATFR